MGLLGDHPGVPAPCKDRDAPFGRCPEPEPPEERVRPLLFRGLLDFVEGIPAGVERMDDLVDGHCDPGRVPSFDHKYGGDLLLAEGTLEDAQAVFVLFECGLVFFFVCFPGEIEFVEHLLIPASGGVVHVFVGHDG